MGDLALPARSGSEPALGGRLSSDEALARLVARGSTRAFALLYRRHHQSLYRYCRAIVRNEQDAEDALHNAMLRALRALQARERDLAVRPWLFRIAHNEAISVLRWRSRDARLRQRLAPGEQAAEDATERREQLATLLVDLRALTERQRSALVMRELSGLSTEEVAAALSISAGAAKQAIFEARCALQEFKRGRAMACDEVRRLISDGDRRILRGRKVAGHLRACSDCRDFREAISARGHALQAFAPPVSAAAATAILERVLGHAAIGGAHAAGAAAASRFALGKPAIASISLKGVATAATVAVVASGGARLALTVATRHHRAPGTGALASPRAAQRAGAAASARAAGPAWSSSLQRRVGGRLPAREHSGRANAASPSRLPSLVSPLPGADGGRGAGLGGARPGGNGSPGRARHGGLRGKPSGGQPRSPGKRGGSGAQSPRAKAPATERGKDVAPVRRAAGAGSGGQGSGARAQADLPVLQPPRAPEPLPGAP